MSKLSKKSAKKSQLGVVKVAEQKKGGKGQGKNEHNAMDWQMEQKVNTSGASECSRGVERRDWIDRDYRLGIGKPFN